MAGDSKIKTSSVNPIFEIKSDIVAINTGLYYKCLNI